MLQKFIRINMVLADNQESGLTTREWKRKIKQATFISQVTISDPANEDAPVIGF